MPEADKASAEPASTNAPRRGRRYRRQLRSRIILSFVLLGFGLTALFAFATQWARNRVENDLVEDVMNRNINEAARQFELDPRNPRVAGRRRSRAFVYMPDRFESVRANRPEWYALPDGIHSLRGDGRARRTVRLQARGAQDAEDLVLPRLRHDRSRSRGETQFQRAIYGSVIVFTLLSLLVGWWAASRVMSPVSELANRLRTLGRQHAADVAGDAFPRRRSRPARRARSTTTPRA